MQKRTIAAIAVIGGVGVTWGVVMGTGPVPSPMPIVVAAIAYPGQSQIEQDVTEVILDAYAYTMEHLAPNPDSISNKGAVEFWSSGGLIHEVPPDSTQAETYESFNVAPSHIRVIVHSDDVATAMFYSEGSFKPKGYPAVSNYLTRVTQTFVKEDGRWVVAVSHFSPITGGSGTSQTALN